MEFNVLDFVPKLLSDGQNKLKWKSLMMDFLHRRGLIGFIERNAAERRNLLDDKMAWKRSDNLVQAWILASISEDIRLRLLRLDTAEEMWMKLEELFEGTSYPHDEETGDSHSQADEEDTGDSKAEDEETEDRHSHGYELKLHKAAIDGNWEKAKGIIESNPTAVTTPFAPFQQTVLSVAVQSPSPPLERDGFVRELLDKMSPRQVRLVDGQGYTALHYAALVDNMEAARMLVGKNPNLPNVTDQSGNTPLPLQFAAWCGHRDMVRYLWSVTDTDTLLAPRKAATALLCHLILGELYDFALYLLKKRPKLALVPMEVDPFAILAEKHSSFKSGSSLSIWQSLIYWGVPIRSEGNIANLHQEGRGGGDRQNAPNNYISVRQRLRFMFWEVAERVVPGVKHMRKKRERQHHALELVKFLCEVVAESSLSEVERIFKKTLHNAVRAGIPDEIIEEIALAYPSALFFENLEKINFIKYAIMYRRESVFNLIYIIAAERSRLISSTDEVTRNNGLHLAARMGHKQQMKLKASTASAVLQMQRELQWFKEVQKFTLPGEKEKRNSDGKTPAELFTDTHKGLVKEGEQWMKDKAGSCTIVSALIAGMAFAAAITIPGGIDPISGHPLLSKQNAFTIFGISDAVALFSSITSVLMFLIILNSRYAEEDFLHALPNKLITGLIALHVSILSTMLASSAILYLVFGGNKAGIFIPIMTLAIIPAILFGLLQFPLLVEMIQSKFRRGIFGKQSKHVLRN